MALRGGLGQREGSRLSESVRRERASECVRVRRSEGCEPPPYRLERPSLITLFIPNITDHRVVGQLLRFWLKILASVPNAKWTT